MSFSKQDARYEAKPLDLSEYSAVDMMVSSLRSVLGFLRY